MKLNFKDFTVYTGIAHKGHVIQDVRETVADMIYLKGAGVAAADLALKIYRSEGEEDYSDRETAIIRKAVEEGGRAVFVDSLREAMNINNKEEEK